VYAAYQQHETGNIHLRVQPTKGVFVENKSKAKEVKLIPVTSTCVVVDSDAKCTHPTHSNIFKHPQTGAMHGIMLGAPKMVYELGTCKTMGGATPFAPAFWVVRNTPDMAEANMSTVTVPVSISVDGDTIKLNIPILQNNKPLKEGDELLVYKSKESEAKAAGLPSVQLAKAGPPKAAKASGPPVKKTPPVKKARR